MAEGDQRGGGSMKALFWILIGLAILAIDIFLPVIIPAVTVLPDYLRVVIVSVLIIVGLGSILHGLIDKTGPSASNS